MSGDLTGLCLYMSPNSPYETYREGSMDIQVGIDRQAKTLYKGEGMLKIGHAKNSQ